MSRLAEIMENHVHLDRLNNLLKHYGVNAEFVTASVLEQLQNNDQESNEELLDDLKQLHASL